MWGLWGDLPLPTIATAFDSARLDEILLALDAHTGELGVDGPGSWIGVRVLACLLTGNGVRFHARFRRLDVTLLKAHFMR
jgi:hypothetical protein